MCRVCQYMRSESGGQSWSSKLGGTLLSPISECVRVERYEVGLAEKNDR